jgi:hypothetical protein
MVARRKDADELAAALVAVVAVVAARWDVRGDMGLSGCAGRPQTAQTSARALSSAPQPKQNMRSRLPHQFSGASLSS